MFTRRTFLASAAAPLAARAAQTRPNIVFVLIDDLRWDAMGITGALPFLKTPHIDRVGREGALFANNFVTTPLCSPSRASFLTSKYVHTHGVRGNGNNAELSHKLVTSGMLLQKAGYETAFCGKWHMGNDPSPRPGWNHWMALPGQGRYENPQMNVDGENKVMDGYVTDILNRRAVDFVRARRDKPFLLYLPHKAVHGPFSPAERHKNLYEGAHIPRRKGCDDDLAGKPVLRRDGADRNARGAGGQHEKTALGQLRTLAAVDDGVGQLLQALEETRQLDNTFFVFTSDNGYIWGEHGLGDKRPMYEESIRIPMLVRYPRRIKAGTTINPMTLNIDLAPTFLELAGVKPPADLQGRSIVPLLSGKPAAWRKAFLAEYFAEPNFPRIPTWHGVRTEEWKLIHYTDVQGMDELYNIKEDPDEMRNLIGEASAQSTLKTMQAELAHQLKATGA
jgi:N-acetylglucosamine-6-sulfatase